MCLSLCHCPGLCPNDNAKLRHAAPALHVIAMCAIVRSPHFPLSVLHHTHPVFAPFPAVCQYVSPSSPMQCPQWPRRHSDTLHIFLCSAPAPFTTHATAAITAYSPPLRRPQKNNLSYRQRHRALQRFVGKSVNWLLLNIPT